MNLGILIVSLSQSNNIIHITIGMSTGLKNIIKHLSVVLYSFHSDIIRDSEFAIDITTYRGKSLPTLLFAVSK